MSRARDLPVPTTTNAPACDTAGLRVAVALVLAPGGPAWDVAQWDVARWAGRESWFDLTGDVRGLVVDRPANDQAGQPAAAHLTLELDNVAGRYSQGGDVQASGAAIAVWTEQPAPEWRFYGFVARWEEDYGEGPNPDARRRQQSVTVEAFDAMGLLEQPIDGLSYALGAEGEFSPARLAYLASLGSWGRGTKLDADVIAHRSIASTNPLLESMQVTAESAGGLVAVDVDGQLLYLAAPAMTGGRTDHAQPVMVITDTCTGDVPLWDGDLVTDDAVLINRVALTNVDGVQVVARDQLSIDRFRTRMLALDAQTWADPRDAQAIADDYVGRHAFLTARVEALSIHDRPPVAPRVGDLIRYVRDFPADRVDVNLRVVALSWSTGPDAGELWQLSTAAASSINAFDRWDDGARWDTARWSY